MKQTYVTCVNLASLARQQRKSYGRLTYCKVVSGVYMIATGGILR